MRLWEHCKSIGDTIWKTDFPTADATLECTPGPPYYSLITRFPISLPRLHTIVCDAEVFMLLVKLDKQQVQSSLM